MLFIIALSGLVGFVAGVRVRLLSLALLAALVACGATAAAIMLALPAWQIALSVILAVTTFELAAFAALSVRVGLSRRTAEPQQAAAKSVAPSRAGAAAIR
ncbi:MAG: hypothetical protein H6Q99_3304 [Proteobacteria bacterium]|nr:hypothetical protein [Pseudomonadota bacterium]